MIKIQNINPNSESNTKLENFFFHKITEEDWCNDGWDDRWANKA